MVALCPLFRGRLRSGFRLRGSRLLPLPAGRGLLLLLPEPFRDPDVRLGGPAGVVDDLEKRRWVFALGHERSTIPGL